MNRRRGERDRLPCELIDNRAIVGGGTHSGPASQLSIRRGIEVAVVINNFARRRSGSRHTTHPTDGRIRMPPGSPCCTPRLRTLRRDVIGWLAFTFGHGPDVAARGAPEVINVRAAVAQ